MVKDIMHQDFIETTVNFPKLIGSTGYLIKILYSRFLIQMCEKKVMCIFKVLPKKITKTRTNYRNNKHSPIKAGFYLYNNPTENNLQPIQDYANTIVSNL